MYWFNSSKLAEDFREGRVDERERFKYYLASLIAWSVVIQVLIFTGAGFNVENLVSAGANLVVIVVGTVLCYRENKRGDDKDFIPRMICLGWPVGVRWTLYLLPVFLFFTCLDALKAFPHIFGAEGISGTVFVFNLPASLAQVWRDSPGILFLLLYFPWIHGELTRVAHSQEETATAEPQTPRLRATPVGGTQSLERLPVKPSPLKELVRRGLGFTVDVVGCIGIIILLLGVFRLIAGLGLSTRFELLLTVVWIFAVSWQLLRLGKWEKARSQRKSA
jgi:hypothetical protein